MAGIFPDTGVSATSARNSLADPLIKAGCAALWSSTSRCTPRFDPASYNAVLSEILNVLSCAGIEYDCMKLDNLCKAVREIAADSITGCIPGALPDASEACSVQNLVLITTADGCKRFAVQTSQSLTIAAGGFRTIVDPSFPQEQRPTSPSNPSTFYNREELKAAIAAGSVNYAKLTPNKLVDLSFTLSCQTSIDVLFNFPVWFDPEVSGGGFSRFVFSIDGNFPLDQFGEPPGGGTFTNFEALTNSKATRVLSAGPHRIIAYVIAETALRKPAQIPVAGSDPYSYLSIVKHVS